MFLFKPIKLALFKDAALKSDFSEVIQKNLLSCEEMGVQRAIKVDKTALDFENAVACFWLSCKIRKRCLKNVAPFILSCHSFARIAPTCS